MRIEQLSDMPEAFLSATHLLDVRAQDWFSQMNTESLFLQLVLVVGSALVGLILSRRIKTRLRPRTPATPPVGLKARSCRFVSGFVQTVALSLIAGSLLAVGARVLILLTGWPEDSLVLCRLGYSLFFAYAVLCLLLAFLQAVLGGRPLSASTRRNVSTVFWSLVVLDFFGILHDLIAALNRIQIPLGKADVTVWTLMVAVFSVIVTLGVANWLAGVVHQWLDGLDNLAGNTKLVLSRIVTVVFMVLAVMIALESVGINLTVLSVFGGAIGVGLGFGLQKIASNYISGFIILLDKSVKIGDMVNVDGFKGQVTQINTRYTVVRSFEGVENIVPNEKFVTNQVLNYSYTFEACVSYLSIEVAYGTDIKRALKILLEEGSRPRPHIDTSRRGWSYLDSFGDSGITLMLGFWVMDPVNGTVGVKTDIACDIVERFNQEGIEIPFNIMELNLRKIDAGEIPVRLVNAGEKAEDAAALAAAAGQKVATAAPSGATPA